MSQQRLMQRAGHQRGALLGGGGSSSATDTEAINELARLLAGGIDSVASLESEQDASNGCIDPARALRSVSKHSLSIPSSYQQAMSSRSAALWQQAMQEEIDSLCSHAVWELCDLPPGRKALPVAWVYDLKRDVNGHVIQYKARLVVDGRKQVKGVDYDRVFAPHQPFCYSPCAACCCEFLQL